MKSDSKISIIVPAYNIKDYIRNAVDSICKQTYKNIEIILVNDGSTDETPAILGEIARTDERIKIIHKENGGVTSARLRGVQEATGDWIGFVDGDDFIEADMYECLLKNAIKYDADISHCGYQMVFPSRTDLYYGTGRFVEQDQKTGQKDLLEGSFIEPGLWNKLFHITLFHNLLQDQKMDLSIKNNEDLLMNFYLFQKAKKSVYIDECYYHYLLRKNSASTAELNDNKLKDPLKVLKALEKETENELDLQIIVQRRIVAQLIRGASLSLGEQRKLIEPYREEMRKELKERLPKILRQDYSVKQKIMAIWVCIWPASYGWVHKVYEKFAGLDKKYEVI